MDLFPRLIPAMVQEVKGNLNEEMLCTVQINFAENIVSSNINEIH